MTAATELSVQTDPSPLDTSKHQLSPFLPRESENKRKRRPLAIQELLEKKRARLAHHGISNGNSNEEEANGNQNINNKGEMAEIIGHICNQDSETSSSSSSTNYNIIDKSLNYLLKSTVFDSQRNFFTESQFMLALQENKNNLARESSPIDEEDDYQKITGNQKFSKLNPMKCSPGILEINEGSVPHDRIFATIPGRLSLLSNVVKYKMTVGEVKRRLMGPECFNFSLLGALLRRAKMPEKSQLLVEELSQVGLAIPRGRRRLSQITLLSALTEAEATQFAKDFQKIAESDFPAKEMAIEVLKQNNVKKTQNFQRLENLSAALKLTMEFLELLCQDKSPVMETNAEQILPNKLQGAFSKFSCLSHGFGNIGIQVGISCFKSFLEHQIKMIENDIAI